MTVYFNFCVQFLCSFCSLCRYIVPVSVIVAKLQCIFMLPVRLSYSVFVRNVLYILSEFL